MNTSEKIAKTDYETIDLKISIESNYVYISEKTLFHELSKFPEITVMKGETSEWITIHAEVTFFLRDKTDEEINLVSVKKKRNLFELKVFGVDPKLYSRLKILGGKTGNNSGTFWIDTITKVTIFK